MLYYSIHHVISILHIHKHCMMSTFISIDEVEYHYKSISVDEEASLPIKLKIIEEDNA